MVSTNIIKQIQTKVISIFAWLIILCLGCNHKSSFSVDQYLSVISIGDSIYANNNSTQDFIDASYYYDSAYAIATYLKNDTLLAHAYLAKGRIYDAWRNDGAKTIAYYSKAAAAFKKINAFDSYIFCSGLTMHAFADNKDSAGAAKTAFQIFNSLHDSLKLKYSRILVLIADECTKIKAYSMAQKILKSIDTKKVINTNLKYRDKFYNANFNIFTFNNPGVKNPYLDSFLINLIDCSPFDSADITQKLYLYYKQVNQPLESFKALQKYNELSQKLNNQNMESKFGYRLKTMEKNEIILKDEIFKKDKIITRAIASIFLIALLASLYLLLNAIKMRKRTEKFNLELQEKYNEIQVMHQEMNHRIKNNIYMVYSMLKMQEKQAKTIEQKQYISETTNRINSMALMHEELFLKQSTKESLSKYLEKIVTAVSEQFSHEQQIIRAIKIENVSLGSNTILPIGLLINELLTNSMKYAKVNKGALLKINLHIYENNNKVFIEYFDNGDTKNLQINAGMGTKLIELLTKQIKAQRVTKENNPFYYSIII